MNAELARLRRARGDSEAFDYNLRSVGKARMGAMIDELNEIMNQLYKKQRFDDIKIKEFAVKFAKCIFIVLQKFDEIGVYPDYFYNQIGKTWFTYKILCDHENGLFIDHQKIRKPIYTEQSGNIGKDNSNSAQSNSVECISLPVEQSKSIKEGIIQRCYCYTPDSVQDVSAAYYDMIDSFNAFCIPHSTSEKSLTQEEFKQAIEYIRINCTNIVTHPLNGDDRIDIIDDIELLSSLLFEYISFFAVVGVDPKDYIALYIPQQEIKTDGK